MESLKSIVIADPDVEYIKSYEEELVLKYCDRAVIQIITEVGYLENYFRMHRSIDVLLIAREFYGAYLKEHNISHMMFVNEKKTLDRDDDEGSFSILKYRPKDEIFDFVEDCLKSESEDMEPEDVDMVEVRLDTRVIAVYSPIGGSGKSLSAIALARKLRKLDENVIVIGCDDFQSLGSFLQTRENADPLLADKLKEISDDIYWLVLKNVYVNEVSFLLPFEKPLSELEIGADQLTDLVNLIKHRDDFNYIVLDLGSTLTNEVRALLSMADVCVFIEESKMSACRMMEKFNINKGLVSIQKGYTIANQYRTEGFRLEGEELFGSLAGYPTAAEAMEDPIFYRLALDITDQ